MQGLSNQTQCRRACCGLEAQVQRSPAQTSAAQHSAAHLDAKALHQLHGHVHIRLRDELVADLDLNALCREKQRYGDGGPSCVLTGI